MKNIIIALSLIASASIGWIAHPDAPAADLATGAPAKIQNKDFKWKANEAEEFPQFTTSWPEHLDKLKSGRFAWYPNDDGSMNLYAEDELGNEWPVLQFDCKSLTKDTKYGGTI